MRYSRCKCGKSEHWGSGMSPFSCTPCDECGTVPASGPNTHPLPTPHEYRETKVEIDGGFGVLTRCMICQQTKAQIEKAQSIRDKKPLQS